jgi:alpha-glucosidase (family GH31 glycosyl hydrolase)
LYPFCRNHNHRSAIDQEPYALGEPTLSAAKVNLKLRYSLLKHLYSSLAAKKGRGAFWRPLFFSFPNVDILY